MMEIPENITAEEVEQMRQRTLRAALELGGEGRDPSVERHAMAAFERIAKNKIPDAEVRRRVEEMEAEKLHEKMTDARRKWNAPKRAIVLENPDKTGPWGETLAKLEPKLGTGFMIALIGGRGPGKTQMGVELMKSHTKKGKFARYVTATEFFMTIKQTYKPTATDSEFDAIKDFRLPSLLVIDETGKRSESDWENRLLFELLDKRYQDMTDTLLISNEDHSQFIEAIGPSLASRMNETGGIIQCTWPSFRK